MIFLKLIHNKTEKVKLIRFSKYLYGGKIRKHTISNFYFHLKLNSMHIKIFEFNYSEYW